MEKDEVESIPHTFYIRTIFKLIKYLNLNIFDLIFVKN